MPIWKDYTSLCKDTILVLFDKLLNFLFIAKEASSKNLDIYVLSKNNGRFPRCALTVKVKKRMMMTVKKGEEKKRIREKLLRHQKDGTR